jgi:hypothetical protein
MKRIFFLILLSFILVDPGFPQEYSPRLLDTTSTQFEKLYFSLTNPDTQLQNTFYPLQYITIDDSTHKTDTLILNAHKWNNEDFNDPYFVGFLGLYSFSEKKCIVKESAEMLVTVQNTGRIKEYYFRKINNEWRLTKIIYTITPYVSLATTGKQPERFEDFIQKFMSDEPFRKSRIIYPLETIRISEKGAIDTTYLPPEQTSPYMFNDWLNIITFYDNYKKQSAETNIRYLSSYGYQNGIKYGDIFQRRKNKWFLLSVWDRSN